MGRNPEPGNTDTQFLFAKRGLGGIFFGMGEKKSAYSPLDEKTCSKIFEQ